MNYLIGGPIASGLKISFNLGTDKSINIINIILLGIRRIPHQGNRINYVSAQSLTKDKTTHEYLTQMFKNYETTIIKLFEIGSNIN